MIWVFRIFCPFCPKKAQGNQRLLQSADSLNIYFIISHACFLVNVFGRIPISHLSPLASGVQTVFSYSWVIPLRLGSPAQRRFRRIFPKNNNCSTVSGAAVLFHCVQNLFDKLEFDSITTALSHWQSQPQFWRSYQF